MKIELHPLRHFAAALRWQLNAALGQNDEARDDEALLWSVNLAMVAALQCLLDRPSSRHWTDSSQ